MSTRTISNEVSRHEFSKLLAKATAVFELDGSRGDKPAAYETVGYMVLDQCDILMAIWDGTPAKGAGGSADIVGEALRRGIPVVRLDPKSEKLDTILTPGGSDSGDRNGCGGIDERLKDTVWRLLLPPLFPDPTGSLHVTERLLARVLGGVWRVFEWALTLRVRRSNRPADFPPESHSTFAFRTQYAGWDRSAQLLSGLYRGAFLLNYVLGVLAVFLAIVGNARSDWFWPPVCESILIAIVITLMLLLRWRRWHLRTADCRYLAEQFRVLCYSYPLGLARCEPHSTNSAQLGDIWLEWHTRAIVRLTPMPTAKVTEWYLEEHVKATRKWVLGQIHYHTRNAARLERIESRLYGSCWVFILAAFSAALVTCFWHAADPGHVPEWRLLFFTAGLPAASAAAHAISTQGEFRKLVERSEWMAGQLRSRLSELNRGTLSAAKLRGQTEKLAHLLLREVSEWQILYRKPVPPPG
jgi:hypothetical protein